MYKLQCAIMPTADREPARSALITACNVSYNSKDSYARITCPDGSVLLKRMSADYFESFMVELCSNAAREPIASIRNTGAWMMVLPDAVEAAEKRVDKFRLLATKPAWDSVDSESMTPSQKEHKPLSPLAFEV